MLLLTVLGVALAEPATDPQLLLIERWCRAARAPVFWGAAERGPLAQARWLTAGADEIDPLLLQLLAPELAALRGETGRALVLRPGGMLAAGTVQPEYRLGDTEPGMLSTRLWADVRSYPGIGEFTARPKVSYDTGEGVGLEFEELWAGAGTAHWTAGAGLRSRWLGPGQHGGLMLTDNARPAPMMSVSGQGGEWGRLGWLRGEVGAGWLNAPRDDVDHPGWLLMDFRWLPLPELELGLSRVGLFGGEGRPTPRIGQLILPTDPHIYDDPDKEEPDQDELAALDIRLTLPLDRWLPLDRIEAWWQYGGEDVIARRSLGIPYPALAGVANLYGARLTAGPWSLTAEGTRVLDDYFRWYTGHRVYHDGFTQDGLSMGYAPGGDAMGLWGALTFLPGQWGGQLSAEQITRVGVVQALGDNLLALAAEERRWRLGVEGWRLRSGLGPAAAGWWRVELSMERIEGLDFIPETTETRWRLALSHR